MKILFCSHLKIDKVIATKFYTWQDNYAVVACAKMRSDLMASIRNTAIHISIYSEMWQKMPWQNDPLTHFCHVNTADKCVQGPLLLPQI